MMVKNILRKSFPSDFAVKVQPGKKPDTLYFKIKYKRNKGSNSTSFKMYKNIVKENGRLVVNMNCEAALTFLKKAKNFKEWKNDHKCAIKIKHDNGGISTLKTRVISDKPVVGADLYAYCKDHCDRNAESNKKGMESYECYLDDVELDKTKEKTAWDKKRKILR